MLVDEGFIGRFEFISACLCLLYALIYWEESKKFLYRLVEEARERADNIRKKRAEKEALDEAEWQAFLERAEKKVSKKEQAALIAQLKEELVPEN